MYELTVESTFSAAHAITIRGEREPLHGHDWRVTLTVAAPTLDPDGLICDFHALHELLRAAIAPFHNRALNDVPPFDRLNPTAEHVARHVGQAVARSLPPGITLNSARVTEAPGCAAIWKPDA